MRRSAWIFLAAILLPSLVLAWMAMRSALDQQVILEHQQAIICQDITDGLAKKVQDQVDTSRAAFVQTTDQLLQASRSPQTLAANFNQKLNTAWNLAEVGFAVDVKGVIYSPRPQEGATARLFRNENDRFLTNRENVEVFAQNTPQKIEPKILPEVNQAVQLAQPNDESESQQSPEQRSRAPNQNSNANTAETRQSINQGQSPQQPQATIPRDTLSQNESSKVLKRSPSQNQGAQQSNAAQNDIAKGNVLSGSALQAQAAKPMAQQAVVAKEEQSDRSKQSSAKKLKNPPPQMLRQVEPQSPFAQNTISNTLPEESDFRKVIGSESSGALARFLEDKLRLMVWYRPKQGPLIFGAQIMQQGLIDSLQPLLQSPEFFKTGSGINSAADYALVILDDRGKPVALSPPGFATDWKHPFAATEIGEALPHWEAALYLLDPKQINRSASTLQLALASIVAVLVAAILLGGWLMAADVRRQMKLAQQKTDFVSNVSHELKTPLTSIRMFADMLSEGRVSERDRQSTYLRIISAESARLTRLINNVLDFARMEKGAPAGEHRACDLVEIVGEVVSICRPHLDAVGITLALEIQPKELPLMGDRDALAQIVLNLLSNAEKYGGSEILVRVREEKDTAAGFGCVDVLDRGPGIPPKKGEAIFQPFERLNDSLASGVSGSGLGLTLARRMAQMHGGNVTYSDRSGGGSCFTLRVPLKTIETQVKVSQTRASEKES